MTGTLFVAPNLSISATLSSVPSSTIERHEDDMEILRRSTGLPLLRFHTILKRY